jgi:hypothetical protein
MLKKLCQALGLASLILVTNYGDLLGGGADVRMHTPFSLAQVCYAHIADLLLLSLLLFLLLSLFARTRFYPWLRLLLAIAIPPYLMQRTQSISSFDLIESLVTLFLVLWTAIVLLLLLRFAKWYGRLMRAGSFVAAALALFASPASRNSFGSPHGSPPPTRSPPTGPPHPSPRASIPSWSGSSSTNSPTTSSSSIALPASRSPTSTLFAPRALPSPTPRPSAFTPSRSFPRCSPAISSTASATPSTTTSGSTTPTNPAASSSTEPSSVFGDAVQSGWRTAAVGWYNPYCSLYAPDIQNCYWTDHDMQDGPMSQSATLAANIASPLQQLAVELVSPARADRDLCNYDLHLRHLTQIDLQQHALQLLRTDQADFVFLHLSLPHSPNTWSRASNDFTNQCGSSYLDNLALTDRVLGQLLAILQSSPRWNQTTLIVQGDHGWRTAIWRDLPAWTEEDEAASRGVFDPRPALLIHQPAQSQPQTVSTPWPLVQIHSVVEQLLHHQSPTL